MRSETEFNGSLDDLPAMLTVEEAARILRIGRSLAYQLATRYLDSGGTDGLPVLRLGGVLPRPWLCAARVDHDRHRRPTRRHANHSIAHTYVAPTPRSSELFDGSRPTLAVDRGLRDHP